MGRKKLTEEQREISKQKRKEYLKRWHEEHAGEYYRKNKAKISRQIRERREKEKGAPLRQRQIVNLKNMSEEQKKEYYRQKMKECRERKKKNIQIIKEFEKLIEEIDSINYGYNDDDYYWHGVDEAKEKIIKLIKNRIKNIKGV